MVHEDQRLDRLSALPYDAAKLAADIKSWGLELGFQQVGISDIDLSDAESALVRWIEAGFHGNMQFMEKHGTKRSRPAELIPGTVSVISARMDYLPESQASMLNNLGDARSAYIARYALGRDYHKVLRNKLQKLAERIAECIGPSGYRAFTDSGPVLEKPIAAKAGLGWIGKHTNLINRGSGSWFFLGEIYSDLVLPTDSRTGEHCGSCNACLDVCPTRAFVGPYQLDARRCISYLTIEHHGSIPTEFRERIGNRIFGCDDCQLVCPWNRFAKLATEIQFWPRNGLNDASLLSLFEWDESTFMQKTEGSAIRRLGYDRWLRNLAIGLGNSPTSQVAINALSNRFETSDFVLREHISWALNKLKTTL